jgi:hypothetical protein
VLVTAPPANGDHRSAAWLVRDHALTVLPAVSSLKALRRVARPSAAKRPMIGFGNPLLDGPESHAQRALLPRQSECAGTGATMRQFQPARHRQKWSGSGPTVGPAAVPLPKRPMNFAP